MRKFYSPMRYPGGKRRLIPVVAHLLETNRLRDIEYVEPYAGSAAVGLALLFEERASHVHINDLSRPVFAIWDYILNDAPNLLRQLEKTPVTMEEWHRCRRVFLNSETADLRELGFAALFLNRTNRSGILSGGVIGGLDQRGEWKLDARFSKPELCSRIMKIHRFRSRISLYNCDASEFVNQVVPSLPRSSFIFFDPPYIENGQRLYLNSYTVNEHKALAASIERLEQPWIVTYDYGAVKHKLFQKKRRALYDLAYSAQDRYSGREVMFFSDKLELVEIDMILGVRVSSV